MKALQQEAVGGSAYDFVLEPRCLRIAHTSKISLYRPKPE